MVDHRKIILMGFCLLAVMAAGSLLTQIMFFLSLAIIIPLTFVSVIRFQKTRIDRADERTQAENALVMADVLNRIVDARCRVFASQGNFVTVTDGRPQFHTRQSAVEPGRPIPDAGAGPYESYPPLMPELLRADRILLIGGMGTGKSTLLKHLISESDNPVVLDPHAGPQTWPCKVIGMGRDYEAIKGEIERIAYLMDCRYQELARGRTDFEPLTLIVDELTVLNQFIDVSEHFKSFLCEARKANIRLIFAGQSDRVAALGIKGSGDLRAGFDAVCYLKRESGLYLGEIEGRKFLHPGPFPDDFSNRSYYHHDHGQDRSEGPDRPFYGFQDRSDRYHDRSRESFHTAYIDYHPGVNPGGDSMEETARRMKQAGESVNAICRALFGKKTAKNYYATKDILKGLEL